MILASKLQFMQLQKKKKSTKKILDFDKIRTQASQKLVRRYYQLNYEASQ